MKETITKDNCIVFVLRNVPEFNSRWKAHFSYWEEFNLSSDLSEFALFIADEFYSLTHLRRIEIFNLLEELAKYGDASVKDGVATSFLETLINEADKGKVQHVELAEYLGETCKAYCRAWTNFTGTNEYD